MGQYGEHQENGLTRLKDQRAERSVLDRLLKMAEEGVVPIDDERIRKAVEGQLEIANSESESAREKSRATAVVEKFVRLNVSVLLKAVDKVAPDQHEHTHHVAELKEALKTAREDEKYVAMERERALKNGSVTGLNGHNGKPGPMANGQASRFG